MDVVEHHPIRKKHILMQVYRRSKRPKPSIPPQQLFGPSQSVHQGLELLHCHIVMWGRFHLVLLMAIFTKSTYLQTMHKAGSIPEDRQADFGSYSPLLTNVSQSQVIRWFYIILPDDPVL